MKYVFQDSVEMPVQKNFISDLGNFLNLIEKIIPLENEAIELNSKIKKEDENLSKRTKALDKFNSEYNNSMETLLKKFSKESMEKCIDQLKESCSSCVERQKENMKKDLEDLTTRSKIEVVQLAGKIKHEIEPFLWTGIYNVNKTQLINGSNDRVMGSVSMKISGFSCKYDVEYSNHPLTVKRFVEGLTIPVWSKGGLIHKDERVRHMDISEFLIKRIFCGEDFHLDLENRKGNRKVNIRLTDDINQVNIKYIDEGASDITSNEYLASQLDYSKLETFIKNIRNYIAEDSNLFSKTLVNLEIDEKDAIENNEVFECLKIIASQYGEILKEIFDHSFTKNEIVIKELIENGTRNEIFMSIDEISRRLSDLGGEGLELKALLNLQS